jgi:hypothetical protein
MEKLKLLGFTITKLLGRSRYEIYVNNNWECDWFNRWLEFETENNDWLGDRNITTVIGYHKFDISDILAYILWIRSALKIA